MLIMIMHLLLIRSNVALTMTSKVFAPSALALFLLLELFLLCAFDLFGGTRCVFFDAQGGCAEEGAAHGETYTRAGDGGAQGAGCCVEGAGCHFEGLRFEAGDYEACSLEMGE